MSQDISSSGTTSSNTSGGPGAGLRHAAQEALHLLQEDVQAHVLRIAQAIQDFTRVT